MTNEALTELVLRSQSGDKDALEQLLFWAHTPVSYLCRKILQNQERAEDLTKEILQITAKGCKTLQDPELFEDWLCRITAARCVQTLPELRWDLTSHAENPISEDIAGKCLTQQETIQAVAALVDTLPEDPRVCILLYCCAKMHSKTIAQVADYTADMVRTNLHLGQTLLQESLEKLQEQGTEFTGITSLQDILHTAMHSNVDADAALPLVYGVLGKELPQPPDPTKWIVRILTVIFLILLVICLGLGGILALKLLGLL